MRLEAPARSCIKSRYIIPQRLPLATTSAPPTSELNLQWWATARIRVMRIGLAAGVKGLASLAGIGGLHSVRSMAMASAASESYRVFALQGLDVSQRICKTIVPPLSGASYKGQMGRIGVLGGSPDYTGAPFYAAQSALRFGADLLFVFCAKQAEGPIKSYSPELMVTSFYDADKIKEAEANVMGDDVRAASTLWW